MDSKQLVALQDKGIHSIIKVIEIKSEDDDDETIPAKKRYAEEHFAVLNEKLFNGGLPIDFIKEHEFYERQIYTFDLLIPPQYEFWFNNLRKGQDDRYKNYCS